MNIQDLIFRKAPLMQGKNFFCNYCARPGFTASWWQAKVKFQKKAEWEIVICSDECLASFKTDERSQKWFDESVSEMKRIHHLKTQKKML